MILKTNQLKFSSYHIKRFYSFSSLSLSLSSSPFSSPFSTSSSTIPSSTSPSSTSPSSSPLSFFESIGNPKYICAPMVDYSSQSWRLFTNYYGINLSFTQMINIKTYTNQFLSLSSSNKYIDNISDWLDYKPLYPIELKENLINWPIDNSNERLEKNLIIQLAGNNLNLYYKTIDNIIENKIKYNLKHIKGIDINLGCPQSIAKKGNYGSYLLDNQLNTINLLTTLCNKYNNIIPITAKIRIFQNYNDTINMVKNLEQTGIKMLTVHGRTKEQSKINMGSADWNIIKDIRNELSIPVIANGGIENYNDIINCIKLTNCNSIMSSEALLENPTLFYNNGEGYNNFINNYSLTQLKLAYEYLIILNSYPPKKYIHNNNNNQFNSIINEKKKLLLGKNHLLKLLYRLINSNNNIIIRNELIHCNEYNNLFNIINKLNNICKQYEYNDNELIKNNYLKSTRWYYRHRNN